MLSSFPGSHAHPSEQEFRALMDGQALDEEKIEALETHLTQCSHCQTLVAHLTDDPFQILVRRSRSSSQTPPPRLAAGYELIEEIGRGASGTVYQALHPSLDRSVALKMMVSGVNASPAELARFRRESDALARLDHPRIVKIFDVGEQEGVPYLAMEWVRGETLKEFLGDQVLATRVVAEIVFELADAIEHAHQQGVLHRDLKPQNILVMSGDSPVAERLKICDFGLARIAESTGFQTLDGETLGTPSYMAPEQVGQQNRRVDSRTDVYGLGAVFYECLTGRPPFHGNHPAETLQLVMSKDPVPVHELRPEIPRDLSVICHRCLSKNPKARFPSAASLRDELQRFLEGKPIRSRSVMLPERMIRWCRRNPWPVTVGLLSLLAAVLIIVGQWNHQKNLARQKNDAESNYELSRQAVLDILEATKLESGLRIPELHQMQLEQLEIAYGLFESLHREDRSRQSQSDLAEIQMQLGSALVYANRTEEGFRLLEEAYRTLSQRFADLDYDNLEEVKRIFSSQIKFSSVLSESDRNRQALKVLQEILVVAHQVARRFESDFEIQDYPPWIHHQMGVVHNSMGNQKPAAEEFAHAVRLREEIADMRPSHSPLLRRLAESQISLAACQMSLGKEASISFQSAISTLNLILSDHPGDEEAILSLAAAQLNYSNIVAESSRSDAIQMCTDGIQRVRSVLAVNPNHRLGKYYASMLYGNRGIFRSQNQQPVQAADDFQNALQFSIDDSTRNLCRRYLVETLLEVEEFDQAIEALSQTPATRNSTEEFQRASEWAKLLRSLCEHSDENQTNSFSKQAQVCRKTIQNYLESLSGTDYFLNHEAHRKRVLQGAMFSAYRQQLTKQELAQLQFKLKRQPK